MFFFTIYQWKKFQWPEYEISSSNSVRMFLLYTKLKLFLSFVKKENLFTITVVLNKIKICK
jgi:hypothetical protein